MEKLFGGKQHLGHPESVAIDQLIEIFRKGIVAVGATTSTTETGGK
jgi:hypothetical protein